MKEATDLKTLIRYKSWADKVFYQSISRLTEQELKQNRSMLYGSIFGLLSHTYSMDVVWKSHIEGMPHGFETRNPEKILSFTELSAHQKTINSWYRSYIDNLNVENHNDIVSFSFIGGGEGSMRVCEIIQHLVNHASYHRGHIEGVLYQISVEPPTTDIPVFLREKDI